MATITRSVLQLGDADHPVPVEWRTSSPRAALPVVIVIPGPGAPGETESLDIFMERLARAGFHALLLTGETADSERREEVSHLLTALRAGGTALPVPSSLAVVRQTGAARFLMQLLVRASSGELATSELTGHLDSIDSITRFLIAQLD